MNRLATLFARSCILLALPASDALAATYIDFSGRLADVNALSGYNHLTNVNGVGASQRFATIFDSQIGLGTNGAGAQYHHIFTNVDQAPGGTTGAITASNYATFDPTHPGGKDSDGSGGYTGISYDHSAYGVGQLSWCLRGPCTGLGGVNTGWNHTSNHILFSVSQTSNVTINLSNAPEFTDRHGPNTDSDFGNPPEQGGSLGGDLIPGFTIYTGVSTSGNNDVNHTFANTANPWTNVTYLDHDANTANAHSITWNSVAEGFGLLAPGYYSLWLGTNFANVANADGTHGKNYSISITAAPVPVPAAVWLLGSALAGVGMFGRRKT